MCRQIAPQGKVQVRDWQSGLHFIAESSFRRYQAAKKAVRALIGGFYTIPFIVQVATAALDEEAA